jgi:hypothetical protein
MGRKPLKIEIVRPLLMFAKEAGERGFTRRDVIDNEIIPENRWATLKNRGLKAGWFVKRGYKKSARYYITGCEPNDDDELFKESVIEEETEYEDYDPDSLFDEMEKVVVEPPFEQSESHEIAQEVDWDFEFE